MPTVSLPVTNSSPNELGSAPCGKRRHDREAITIHAASLAPIRVPAHLLRMMSLMPYQSGCASRGVTTPPRPSAVLRRLHLRYRRAPVTIGAIAAHLGHESAAGWLLLLLSLPALIPTPGVPIGVAIGIAMTLIAVQLIGGWQPLRLPRWLARRELGPSEVRRIGVGSRRLLRCVEGRLCQRLPQLISPMAVRLLGLLVLIHGILIALPIPLGNTAPGAAVLVLALGLIARDGWTVALGLCLSVIAFAVTAFLVGSAAWIVQSLLAIG
jgi:hypothetical protein